MRWLLFVALAVSTVVAAILTTQSVSTDANAAPLCHAPGVPKGCVARPAAGTVSSSYDSAPKGRIIVPAPPGGRPIGYCMDCIAPHYAWPPSGGAP